MSTPGKKDALGKGIRSLLKSIDDDLKTTAGQLKPTVAEAVTSMLRIPVADIEINPKQPRRDFDEQALKELSESIKNGGSGTWGAVPMPPQAQLNDADRLSIAEWILSSH